MRSDYRSARKRATCDIPNDAILGTNHRPSNFAIANCRSTRSLWFYRNSPLARVRRVQFLSRIRADCVIAKAARRIPIERTTGDIRSLRNATATALATASVQEACNFHETHARIGAEIHIGEMNPQIHLQIQPFQEVSSVNGPHGEVADLSFAAAGNAQDIGMTKPSKPRATLSNHARGCNARLCFHAVNTPLKFLLIDTHAASCSTDKEFLFPCITTAMTFDGCNICEGIDTHTTHWIRNSNASQRTNAKRPQSPAEETRHGIILRGFIARTKQEFARCPTRKQSKRIFVRC